MRFGCTATAGSRWAGWLPNRTALHGTGHWSCCVMLSFIYSFIFHSFTECHSFTHSFIYSFIFFSFLASFLRSCIHSCCHRSCCHSSCCLIGSVSDSFIYLSIHSFNHWSCCLIDHVVIYLLTYSFIHLFSRSLVRSFLRPWIHWSCCAGRGPSRTRRRSRMVCSPPACTAVQRDARVLYEINTDNSLVNRLFHTPAKDLSKHVYTSPDTSEAKIRPMSPDTVQAECARLQLLRSFRLRSFLQISP